MKNRSQALSWQLLKAVLSIYFLITFLVTFTQMGIEYLHTRKTIETELESVERTFSPALTAALWELNFEQLEALHKGIVDLPIISSMDVVDANGKTLIQDSENGLLGGEITHTFKLIHYFSGENVFLADVSFKADGSVVFDRIRVGFQMIAISALIKSTVLTILFLWAFRNRLGIPLQKLTETVTAIDLNSLGDKHLVDLQQPQENELTKLEEAFNHMLKRLEDERVAHYLELKNLNQGLEQQVAERTHDLQVANQKLEQLVRIDPLTGAASRRHFVEQFQVEIQRSQRDNTPLSILMMDLDHFKKINDAWGHAAGDQVLYNFSHGVMDLLRSTDFFARLGGEEFALLLPNTQLDGAVEVALRVLEVARQQFIAWNDEKIRYSVSIGAALLASEETNFESLLKRADDALYRAKAGGRNQVIAEKFICKES